MSETQQRVKGVVARFGEHDSFGFISCPTVGEDVFVHFSELEWGHVREEMRNGDKRRYLLGGDRVEFEVEKSSKGFKALRVRVVGEL